MNDRAQRASKGARGNLCSFGFTSQTTRLLLGRLQNSKGGYGRERASVVACGLVNLKRGPRDQIRATQFISYLIKPSFHVVATERRTAMPMLVTVDVG